MGPMGPMGPMGGMGMGMGGMTGMGGMGMGMGGNPGVPFGGFGSFNGPRNLGPGILGGPRFGNPNVTGRGRGTGARGMGKPETCTSGSENEQREENTGLVKMEVRVQKGLICIELSDHFYYDYYLYIFVEQNTENLFKNLYNEMMGMINN